MPATAELYDILLMRHDVTTAYFLFRRNATLPWAEFTATSMTIITVATIDRPPSEAAIL